MEQKRDVEVELALLQQERLTAREKEEELSKAEMAELAELRARNLIKSFMIQDAKRPKEWNSNVVYHANIPLLPKIVSAASSSSSLAPTLNGHSAVVAVTTPRFYLQQQALHQESISNSLMMRRPTSSSAHITSSFSPALEIAHFYRHENNINAIDDSHHPE